MSPVSPEGMRLRFRFRVQKRLDVEASELPFRAGGRDLALLSRLRDQKLRDANWLVMRARGFPDEEAAREYGSRLKVATALASVRCRLGVDVGEDLATSAPGKFLVEKLRAEEGVDLRADVHGVDIFPDTDNVRVLTVSAEGSVRASPDRFLEGVSLFMEVPGRLQAEMWEPVLLLNAALLNTEPLAQLVLAISAVEMLGQSQKWTEGQRKLLDALALDAAQYSELPDAERLEVSDAIARSAHRLSLRQGVIRLLSRLDLGSLKREWDEVYGSRSAIFHGLGGYPKREHAVLAHRATSLAGRIVLTAVAQGMPHALDLLDLMYPGPGLR